MKWKRCSIGIRCGSSTSCNNRPSSHRSELKAQPHLKLARIPYRAGYLSDLRVANVLIGQSELRVVEYIERFSAEFEPHLFANHEILEQRHIPIDTAGSEERVAAEISISVRRGSGES